MAEKQREAWRGTREQACEDAAILSHAFEQTDPANVTCAVYWPSNDSYHVRTQWTRTIHPSAEEIVIAAYWDGREVAIPE
jgi:hypothetical protein